MLYGARYSIGGALLASSLAVLLGMSAGLMGGYYRGWVESSTGWVSNLVMTLPAFLVLLAARSVLGPSTWAPMILLGFILAPAIYRVVLATTVSTREELYVDAARVSGLSDARIVSRHIVSAVRAPVIIMWALMAGVVIAIQSGLDFLGIDDPNTPTWGNILNDGFAHLQVDGTLLIWPSLAIALTSLAFVLVGNALRDELEHNAPFKTRRRRKHAPPSVAGVDPALTLETVSGPSISGPQPLLKVSGLTVAYEAADGSDIRVVEGINLEVHRGRVHGLVGESGSGKTQTALALLGLLPRGGHVVAGRATFDGVELIGVKARSAIVRGRRIGYVPQEPMSNLDPAYTVGSQLAEPLRAVAGLNRTEAKARALELLEQVGIAHPARTFAAYPHEISGGMAQRVLIAGAISSEPDLLIADEPTTALDVTVQAEILDLMRDLKDRFGLSILIVTHNFGVVADLCDSVSVMRKGRIVEDGPVRTIFFDPRHDYTQSLLNAVLTGDGPVRPCLAAARGTTPVPS